jgi:hypothetical protein
MRFANENAGKKRLRVFLAGHGFFVDPVAVQVGLSPNRPMFPRVFPFQISDGMGEFVNKGIYLDLLGTTAIDADAEISIHPKAIT